MQTGEQKKEEYKQAILKRCLSLLLATYPPETVRFLKGEKDRFQNPVWYTISHEMESLYDELMGGMDLKQVTRSLENIIRIRAVQDFTPDEALSFVSHIRQALNEELIEERYEVRGSRFEVKEERGKERGERLKGKGKRSEVRGTRFEERGSRYEVKESDKDDVLGVEDLAEIEVRMDRIAALASAIYQAAREKIYELQLRGLNPPPAPRRKPGKP